MCPCFVSNGLLIDWNYWNSKVKTLASFTFESQRLCFFFLVGGKPALGFQDHGFGRHTLIILDIWINDFRMVDRRSYQPSCTVVDTVYSSMSCCTRIVEKYLFFSNVS